ncbi:MAG: hypothetical protein ACI9KE_003247 [Polyangiales bacterium]|jgi:hypothetical protein
MTCSLCLQATQLALTPFGELQLCPSCVRGNLGNSLKPIGVTLTATQTTVVFGRNDNAQRLEVNGHMSGLTGQRARFSRLSLLTKLIDPFSPRAKTGDDIYDAHVRGRGRHPAWVARLLESDAVRSACIEITVQEESFIKIEGDHVRAEATGDHLGGDELNEMARGVGVILREMARMEERWPAG